MNPQELYMHRCLELAALGTGHVAPNPMVGAVLVHGERIIGEGYHRQYGQAHAEVNCINSVLEEDRHLIDKSVIYVSLEPCAHYGKTPPCADLIIRNKIPEVVVGCRDPFEKVDGKGIERLRHAGIRVVTGILEKECKELNKRFFTFHTKHLPYIVLKWAQSKNNRIANADFSRVLISNAYTNRQVHKWRSEEAAIMVGTNTALHDNPSLNARHWSGPEPVRLMLDMNLRLPSTLQVFNLQQQTVVFNHIKNEEQHNLLFCKIDAGHSVIEEVLNACYKLNIQSILVEGGARLLQSFINENTWDEARVIENSRLTINNGLAAPQLSNAHLVKAETTGNDAIYFYTPG